MKTAVKKSAAEPTKAPMKVAQQAQARAESRPEAAARQEGTAAEEAAAAARGRARSRSCASCSTRRVPATPRQAEELEASAEQLASEREQGDTQFDEESGEGDTVSVERERDLSLSATARQTVDDIDRALAADTDRHVRRVRDLPRSHPGRAARGHPVGRAVREVQGPWRTASLRREGSLLPGRAPLGWSRRSSSSSPSTS